MSLWYREETALVNLPQERQAKIEIVASAYASVFAEKAYLTMPVTSGKRFYDTLDKYRVKNVQELERVRPGALREEVIVPNIEEGKQLAFEIRKNRDVDALIVPGIFEARKERWTQEEYMILWLQIISGSVRRIYLSPDWAYSNGGAMEVSYGLSKQLGLVGDFSEWLRNRSVLEMYDFEGRVDIVRVVARLCESISDLTSREHDTKGLRAELVRIRKIAEHGAELARTDFHYNKVVTCIEKAGL